MVFPTISFFLRREAGTRRERTEVILIKRRYALFSFVGIFLVLIFATHYFLVSKSLLFNLSSANNFNYKLHDTATAKTTKPTAINFSKHEIVDATQFSQANCDLTGVDWYPVDDLAWQQRVPAFLLIGAKKAGTTTLWAWLKQHPSIRKAQLKELLYFVPNRFRHRSEDGKVLVHQSRAEMYELHYNVSHFTHSNLISYEATPEYLFRTTRIIPVILCTCPWVKLLVTLREPVARLFSHYNFNKQIVMAKLGKNTGSLQGFIESDMRNLRKAGVIQDVIPNEHFYGSEEELQAWDRYVGSSNKSVEGAIGRGLYIIQLEAWYKALHAIGRNPESEIFVIRNEDMRNDPDESYNKVLSWLNLQPKTLKMYKEFLETKYGQSDMSDEMRAMLKSFYKPYNQRLYKLLGKDWTDEWDNGEGYKIPQHQLYNESLHSFLNNATKQPVQTGNID